MNATFKIYEVDNNDVTFGSLDLEINGKNNTFGFTVDFPEYEDFENIDLYSFSNLIYKRNKECSRCFKFFSDNLDNDNELFLFDLNIRKEFEDIDKEQLKRIFLEIDKIIIDKLKEYFIKNNK